ncbi:uncharacterized protein YALI1_F17581g [Yarrowia lipolytica]|uniref:Uncharacterized protein n=1 Tax=Yarrowia lipolytica TaxID=4952 RepID=A0A1D8NNA4_YARLL|nr:hypothetical protein YALI1_F17581g [Yarrowia lipolytica]
MFFPTFTGQSGPPLISSYSKDNRQPCYCWAPLVRLIQQTRLLETQLQVKPHIYSTLPFGLQIPQPTTTVQMTNQLCNAPSHQLRLCFQPRIAISVTY